MRHHSSHVPIFHARPPSLPLPAFPSLGGLLTQALPFEASR